MDSSRRAVESYWRSRLIDGATSNEDKVTPVFKLEEICELLRYSPASTVKEVSEFVLKRLDHKSPIVKQKALRLIKYCVGKSGLEFQREMQRHSVAIRQLLHYRGQPDPLKGDALNKAIRDSAQEAIAVIFSKQNAKSEPAENLSRRIEGFGNTNFHMASKEKRSFLSKVVDLGSVSIEQGLSSFTQGHSFKNNGHGSYKGPNVHRSLTVEKDYSDRYVPVEIPRENQGNFGTSKDATTGRWNSEASTVQMETSDGESTSKFSQNRTCEERLLGTIVTSGGVRLQPTQDAIQVFLFEAAKMDALALCQSLESKLQLPQWQVRMKALCVLGSIIRKRDEEPFSIIASYFSENKDGLIKCCESPQASLREKAKKVLNLLGGEYTSSIRGNLVKSLKTEKNFVEMPNLIDTGDSDADNFFETEDSLSKQIHQDTGYTTTHTPPIIDDLFGGGVENVVPSQPDDDDDPFADVSFHSNEGRDHTADIFTGMNLSKNQDAIEDGVTTHCNRIELFDTFKSSLEISSAHDARKNDVTDLMAGLSINKDASKTNNREGASILEKYPASEVSHDSTSNLLDSQGIGAKGTFGNSSMPNSLLPGMMLNPAFVPQQVNHGPIGNFFDQQQLLAAMAHYRNLGNLTAQSIGSGQALGDLGGYSSPFPDIFQSNFANQAPTSTMNNLKKEDTKAFDFISDHLAAARDPKKVL